MRQGLYLITNDEPFDLLSTRIACALQQGVAYVQYRRKHISSLEQHHEALHLREICQGFGVPLIINDNIALAASLDCGVHLGQADGSVAYAREALLPNALIGRTCHHSAALAAQAQIEGASYLAMGAIYPSPSKPDAATVDFAVLEAVVRTATIPVCVIGGLTVENAAPLRAIGVELFAVISDVLDLPCSQVATRVQEWNQLLLTGDLSCPQV